jgi:hypothetical protein
MKEPENFDTANIQRPFLEYGSSFKEPITSMWYGARQGEVVGAMLKALSPWHLRLDNISWNQGPKNLAEAQVTFAVPSLLASIQLGVGGINTSAINPDWSQAAQFVSLFQTAVDTLKSVVTQELSTQQTTLGFHVVPDKRPFRDSLSRFVNVANLGVEDAKMSGVSAYYTDSSFVIDGSAAFPDAVFIKLNRTYSGNVRFEEMADTIHRDEEKILRLLGLKLQ